MSASDWNPIPEDIRENDLMILAWRDCLMWAIGYTDILNQFASETGRRLSVSSSGINALVDKATGFQDAELRRFIEWFNANVWGPVGEIK